MIITSMPKPELQAIRLAKILFAFLLLCVAVVIFHPGRVYIELEQPLPAELPATAEDNQVLYFWSNKKHAGLYEIGREYRLSAANNNDIQARLSTITYATSRPDEMRLGFKAKGQKWLVANSQSRFSIDVIR